MGKFGDFNSICSKTALPLCSVVKSNKDTNFPGILPQCYARSVELANTLIFQVGTSFVHFGGLVVILIIIFNVRSKYTAIGRLELLFFNYLFTALTIASLVVDCGVSPPGSTTYGYFVAAQIGLAASCCWSLAYNGLLGFQLWEDGTRMSMIAVRLTAIVAFALNFIVALLTFKGWAGDTIDKSHTMGLFVVMYLLNALSLLMYVLSQVVLLVFYLKNWWALGALSLGLFFFVAAQIITYTASIYICEGVNHYIDGLFFGTLANLFAVMMIYKYWDMITADDLEFSVNSENSNGMINYDDFK